MQEQKYTKLGLRSILKTIRVASGIETEQIHNIVIEYAPRNNTRRVQTVKVPCIFMTEFMAWNQAKYAALAASKEYDIRIIRYGIETDTMILFKRI